MKAAIYARTASQEQGTINQIELCRDYILGKSGEVVCIFDDEGISAHDLKRDGLVTLMEAATQNKFDTLVVASYDRLFRDHRLMKEFMDGLGQLKISLVVVKTLAST